MAAVTTDGRAALTDLLDVCLLGRRLGHDAVDDHHLLTAVHNELLHSTHLTLSVQLFHNGVRQLFFKTVLIEKGTLILQKYYVNSYFNISARGFICQIKF